MARLRENHDPGRWGPKETKERGQQLREALSLFGFALACEGMDVAQKLAGAQTAQCIPYRLTTWLGGEEAGHAGAEERENIELH